MKAERMIKILILLQYGETVSTPELAKELEVSERTIHRDMEALSRAGIPVYSQRGKAGGWRLIDDWKQKLSWLKEKELQLLFLPPADKILTDLDIDISSKEVKNKLLLSLPEPSRQQAKSLWERVYVDMGTWKNTQTDITAAMDTLHDAVMNEQKAKIFYKKANGVEKESMIQPLGLVAKASTWYVVAINENGDYRSYKVVRISQISIMDDYFERPADFDLASYWKNSKKSFTENLPKFSVEVKVSSSACKRMMFTGRFVTKVSEKVTEDGWAYVELTFQTEEEAVNFIIGFGDQILVVSPESLISKVTKRAKEVLSLYEE
ncbi:helix-turn-helix transcriptional regulator [Halobacillus mangrovi]|uniref:helix-turn-helix transcriptional regulator n=1 Tax=Halobacillus mangrovi TaxID=402384 RepID=UPI003D98217D